jgi:hypothetical protein
MNFSRVLGVPLILLLSWPLPLGAEEVESPARHPSYNLVGRDAPAASSPLNPNFVVSEEAHLRESGFWRSGYINESLVGLAVTDIDRDGKNEVIYATEKNIFVTRFNGGALAQLAKYSVPATQRLVSVDVLDVDGDGRMEIIASAQDENNAPIGLILKFNDGAPTPLAQRLPWYLRVVGQGNNRFLAGQKAAPNGAKVFSGSIMKLAYNGSGLTSQGPVGLPDFVNLFNFAIGPLGESGALPLTAAIKFPSEHIFLYENKNRAWESREEYGGTMVYLAPQNYKGAGDRKREFLPTRLIIADIDGDGRNELLAAKNDRGGVPFMSNQRAFTSGVIQAFKYVNMSLSPFFRTRTLPGPAVDFQLVDFNNNGTLDLVVAVVTEQKSGLMQEGRSIIVAYELTPQGGGGSAASAPSRPQKK